MVVPDRSQHLPRVAGEVLGDTAALRSHLAFYHGVYVETTLTLKDMNIVHDVEHGLKNQIKIHGKWITVDWTVKPDILIPHTHAPSVARYTISDEHHW